MLLIPYRQRYIGNRRYPLENLKYTNSWTRKRKEEYELYIKQKKSKQARRRKQLIAELRQTSNRIDQD